ncbi:MAG: DMT family transporter [Candidatus Heimdallarchaeota archaeon]|nr:DMT family transporter [Candidatus Heimdallarchaeota archaeon]
MAGEILALATAITFPLANAMLKKIDNLFTPSQINAIRTSVGAISFVIFILIFNQWKFLPLVPTSLLILLLISIFFGQVIGDTSYFMGQEYLGTTLSLTITSTMPFFTFLISIIIGEQISLTFFLSGIIIGAGIILISKSQISREEVSLTRNRTKYILSVITLLIASLSWAIAIVLTDIGFNALSELLPQGEQASFLGNAIRLPFAAVILCVIGWKSRSVNQQDPDSAYNNPRDRKVISILLVASLIGTTLGILLYSEAAQQAGAAFTALILTASPLFSIPISWSINREKISSLELIGLLLILTGVILVLM